MTIRGCRPVSDRAAGVDRTTRLENWSSADRRKRLRTLFRWLLPTLAAAVCGAAGGCGGQSSDTSNPPVGTRQESLPRILATADSWQIVNTEMMGGEVYLGNGFVGFQSPSGGATLPGRGPQTPPFGLVAGGYKDDALVPLPDPASFSLKVGSSILALTRDQIQDYRQTLDMKNGVLTSGFNWSPGGKKSWIMLTIFPSRDQKGLVVVHISAPALPGITAEHMLRPAESAAPGAGVSEFELPQSSANPGIVMLTRSVISPGRGFEWTGYTDIETTDDGPNPRQRAATALAALNASSYAMILARHKAAWNDLWRSDITVDGDRASQQMIHAAMFYLLESTRTGSHWSIPPMGLSNNNWGGHIFWDAEMWMFPALVLLHPAEARPLVDYREAMLSQAKALAAGEGRPGASYPWESARSGREDAAAPYNQERHVTADVANMAWRYYLVTGDRSWLKRSGWPILQNTTAYWTSRMTRGPDGLYHIRPVVGPDETAGVVDDDAFTNGVVQVNLSDAAAAAHELGVRAPPEWTARKLALPRDPHTGIYLAHAGYAGDKLKQADPSLLIYPLGLVTDPAIIKKMLLYYPPRVAAGGPAMTDSIYSTIAARNGDGSGAFKLFERSYRRFLVPPFDQMSEKHSTVRQYTFVTGLGGLLQSVIYGFGGVTPSGSGITAHPHLPPTWKRLRITGIHYRNRIYNLDATQKASTLSVQP